MIEKTRSQSPISPDSTSKTGRDFSKRDLIERTLSKIENGEPSKAEAFETYLTAAHEVTSPSPGYKEIIVKVRPGEFKTLVDADLYEKLNSFSWRPLDKGSGRVYAVRDAKGPDGKPLLIYLHRQIKKAKKGEKVDHANRLTLDNRSENLRVVTSGGNAVNRGKSKYFGGKPTSSDFIGVTWDRGAGKWRAQLRYNGKNLFLGHHTDPWAAARAYDERKLELHGELASLNREMFSNDLWLLPKEQSAVAIT